MGRSPGLVRGLALACLCGAPHSADAPREADSADSPLPRGASPAAAPPDAAASAGKGRPSTMVAAALRPRASPLSFSSGSVSTSGGPKRSHTKPPLPRLPPPAAGRTPAAAATAGAASHPGSSTMPASAFLQAGALSFAAEGDSASDSGASSLPASEMVFGLASRASVAPPPAAVIGPAAAAAAGQSGPSGAVRANSILQPMDGARTLSSSKSMPSRLVHRARSVAAPPATMKSGPFASTASASAAMPHPASAPSLKRAPSLSASEWSYTGSSLLSAAFDRQDTRRAFTNDSANADSASNLLSAGSGSPTGARAGAGAVAAERVTPKPAGAGGGAKAGSEAGAGVVDAEAAAALAAVREFAEAFLKALASGDAKWGSDPGVSGLFAEGARMLTHDGQLFTGRTAILRRLNAGMAQLHTMLGAMPEVQAGTDAGGLAQQLADRVQHTLDVRLAPRDGAAIAAKGGLLRRLFRRGPSAKEAAAHRIASARGGGSVRVIATYSFRFGLRRFRLIDHFAVRSAGGRAVVVRLKRTRG